MFLYLFRIQLLKINLHSQMHVNFKEYLSFMVVILNQSQDLPRGGEKSPGQTREGYCHEVEKEGRDVAGGCPW